MKGGKSKPKQSVNCFQIVFYLKLTNKFIQEHNSITPINVYKTANKSHNLPVGEARTEPRTPEISITLQPPPPKKNVSERQISKTKQLSSKSHCRGSGKLSNQCS